MKVVFKTSLFIFSLILLSCDEDNGVLRCNTYYIKFATAETVMGKPKYSYLYNEQGMLSKVLNGVGNEIEGYYYEENKLIYASGDAGGWEFAYDIEGKVKYAMSYQDNYTDSLTFEYNANGQVVRQNYYTYNFSDPNYVSELRRYILFQYGNTNGVSQQTYETNPPIYPAFELVLSQNFSYDNKTRSGHPELFFYENVANELPAHINNLTKIANANGSTPINYAYEYNQDGVVTKRYRDNLLLYTYEHSCSPTLE